MAKQSRRKGKSELPGWIALVVGIAAGWAFLIGLYLGFSS